MKVPVELTHWEQMLCIHVSDGRIAEYASKLRVEYDALPWWAWIRGLRLRHKLRIVTVVQDAYEIGKYGETGHPD